MIPNVAATPESRATTCAVAAYGLETALTFPSEPLGDDTFQNVLLVSESHRTLGLLGEAVRAGAFPTTDAQHHEIEDRLAAWDAHAVRVERLLLDAVTVLERFGIEHRVLKGIALSHHAYPAPEWRVFGDADLLLRTGSFHRGVEVLCDELGAAREQPELRRGFDERFGKEALLKLRGGLELDVHRMFEEGALGLTIDVGDLFAGEDRFELGGRALPMLPAEQQLLHGAYAAVLGEVPPRLMNVRDVAQVVSVLDPDEPSVRSMARRWQAEALLARGLALAWETLGLSSRPGLVEWAAGYVPSARERRLLDAHLNASRAHTRHLAALLVLPGLRQRAAYLQALVWPDRAYLEARGFTRTSFARRGRRHLRPG